jgi:predicted nucleotidyltransferase
LRDNPPHLRRGHCRRCLAIVADTLMGARLPIEPERLADLCRRHRIRRLSLFGSRLKGTARPDSDVDLLVEFEAGTAITLFDMARIEIELSTALGGRKVDLRTAGDLSRHFRDEVLRSAEPQYVAG